ncbi:MAG: hypothetical protein RIR70_761, partial [Pseudomonadota bacterium]
LLGLTLAAWQAHACKIERPDPQTVTIVGECGEKVLMSQLSIAIRDLEARGELTRANSGESSQSKQLKKLDLVNGASRGSTATFFHRSGSKK